MCAKCRLPVKPGFYFWKLPENQLTAALSCHGELEDKTLPSTRIPTEPIKCFTGT